MIHRLRYSGGAQTLYHVPRDRDARARVVASATYSIVALWRSDSDAERTVQASTAATVDSTSTTLDGSAGPSQGNPRLIPLTSETGVSPGHYYLISQGELSELVQVESTDTGQALAMSELRHDYTSGADFDGIEVTGTFPSASAADEDDLEGGGGPYGVIWSYTISSIPYYPLEEAWVVRYTTQPLITVPELVRRWPMVPRVCAGRWNPEDAIAAASEDFLADLEESGRDPHNFKHAAVTRVCVANRALEYIRRWEQTDDGANHADMLRSDYERRMSNLLTGEPPLRTAEVSQVTDTAKQGGSDTNGAPIIRRS